MAITIKDVAALAGVSPSTVSRTCKDNPSISRETKEKVRRAMAQLGYDPSAAGSTASLQSCRTIGIILPPSPREAYENPFYLEAIRGISQFCNDRQYASTILTGRDNEEILSAIQFMMRKDQIDGFIVLIGKAHRFANQTIYIDNDNLLAGQEATEYLYALGHRKIAYFGTDSTLLFSADRKAGYQSALLRHGITPNPAYCIEENSPSCADGSALQELLLLEDAPTAMVVSDDILAVALERACGRLGLSIPKDLSIISFNNSLFARLTSPQLTSIDVNSFQLGTEAASQLINHIENPNLPATKSIVPHTLVKRDSCRRLAQEAATF